MRNAIMAALLMTTTACMTPVVLYPAQVQGEGAGAQIATSLDAAAPAVELENVVVTATRTSRRLDDVPVRTEVVGRDMIDRLAARTLADAIEWTLGPGSRHGELLPGALWLEAGRPGEERDPGNPAAPEAHRVVHPVDRERRVGVEVVELGITRLRRRVEQVVGVVEERRHAEDTAVAGPMTVVVLIVDGSHRGLVAVGIDRLEVFAVELFGDDLVLGPRHRRRRLLGLAVRGLCGVAVDPVGGIGFQFFRFLGGFLLFVTHRKPPVAQIAMLCRGP